MSSMKHPRLTAGAHFCHTWIVLAIKLLFFGAANLVEVHRCTRYPIHKYSLWQTPAVLIALKALSFDQVIIECIHGYK